MSRHRTSLLVLQPSCIGDYFPLDPQTYSSTTQNTQYTSSLPAFPFWLYCMRHLRIILGIYYLLFLQWARSLLQSHGDKVQIHCWKTLLQFIHNIDKTSQTTTHPTTQLIRGKNYGYNSHFPNSLPVDWYPSSYPCSNLHWTSGIRVSFYWSPAPSLSSHSPSPLF